MQFRPVFNSPTDNEIEKGENETRANISQYVVLLQSMDILVVCLPPSCGIVIVDWGEQPLLLHPSICIAMWSWHGICISPNEFSGPIIRFKDPEEIL